MVRQIVSAELFKLLRRPISKILLAALLLFLVLNYFSAYLLLSMPARNVPQELQEPLEKAEADAMRKLTLPTSLPFTARAVTEFGELLVVVLAAAAVGSEFTWGTLRTLLLNEPNRTKLLVAKLIALSVVTAVGLLLGLAFGTILSATITSLLGHPLVLPWESLPGAIPAFLGSYLVLLTWLLLGFFLAVVSGQTVVGIAGGFFYFLTESLLTGLPVLATRAASVAPYLLGFNSTVLVTSLDGTVASGLQSASILIAYALVFLVLSLLFFRRKQIGF